MSNNPNFDDYFNSRRRSEIFANYHYLTPEYHPETLVDRKEQIDMIWQEIEYALNHHTIPKHFFLYGLPGTGKTATMEHILRRMTRWMAQKNKPAPLIYFNNCVMYNTPYRILRQLCLLLKTHLPSSGFSTEEAYSRFIKAFKRHRDTRVILILDELDFLFEKKKAANDLLYKLIRPPSSEINSMRISVFGITNDVTLMSSLDPRVKSSLNPEELYFPPYTAIELQQILYKRASKALKPKILQYGVIERISAHFAKEDGDARQAIAVLRTSAELAEKSNTPQITETHATTALQKYSTIEKENIINTLPTQSKIVLQSIQLLQKRHHNQLPISGEIYDEYKRLCHKLHNHTLTYRQFSNHIKKLEKLNLISAEHDHRGTGGNTRKITFYFP